MHSLAIQPKTAVEPARLSRAHGARLVGGLNKEVPVAPYAPQDSASERPRQFRGAYGQHARVPVVVAWAIRRGLK